MRTHRNTPPRFRGIVNSNQLCELNLCKGPVPYRTTKGCRHISSLALFRPAPEASSGAPARQARQARTKCGSVGAPAEATRWCLCLLLMFEKQTFRVSFPYDLLRTLRTCMLVSMYP